MSEYNFEPDYVTWWKKKDVTRDQLCWLALGINPDDVERQRTINQKTEPNHDEILWGGRFRRYTDSLPQGLWLGDAHACLMRCVEQGKTKVDFVKNLYELAHDFPVIFEEFLLRLRPTPMPTAYNKYLDKNIFRPMGHDHILLEAKNELAAFANILGLEEKFFSRMIAMKNKEKEMKEKDEEVCWKDMSPDDRHFIKAYRNFLKNEYPYFGSPDTLLYDVWIRAKDLNLWHDNISQYINALHNAGFIFTDASYARMAASGIEPEYTDDGWAIQFYKRWIEKGLWTLDDAVDLYLGSDPYHGREFIGLANPKPDKPGRLLLNREFVVFIDEKGEMEKSPVSREDATSLKQFIADNLAAGNLKGVEVSGYDGFKFKPIDIVIFFRDYCPNTYQPLALFSAINIPTHKKQTKSILEERAKEAAKKIIPKRMSVKDEREDIIKKSLVFIDEYYRTHAAPPKKPDVVNFLKRKENGYAHISETSLLKKFTMEDLLGRWRTEQVR